MTIKCSAIIAAVLGMVAAATLTLADYFPPWVVRPDTPEDRRVIRKLVRPRGCWRVPSGCNAILIHPGGYASDGNVDIECGGMRLYWGSERS